jgi:hypothetical protein
MVCCFRKSAGVHSATANRYRAAGNAGAADAGAAVLAAAALHPSRTFIAKKHPHHVMADVDLNV